MEEAEGILMMLEAVDWIENQEKVRKKLIHDKPGNEPGPSGWTIPMKRKRMDKVRRKGFGEMITGKVRRKEFGEMITDKVRRKGFGEMIAERGGEDVVLVMEKSLPATDVSRSHGRVSLPTGKLREQFLNKEEWLRVDGEGMDVAVVDEQFRNYNLRLTNWKMGTTRILNLNGDWNQVVRNNELASDDVVQLWSYRLTSRLCFGVIKAQAKVN